MFESIEYKIVISSNSKAVEFNMVLESYIDIIPLIINDTIINRYVIDIGKTLKSIYLFKAIGYNLTISSIPSLPNGLFIDNTTCEIYGMAIEDIESGDFTFTVKNYYGSVKVIIYIELKKIYCKGDGKFNNTLATEIGTDVSIDCGAGETGEIKRTCYLIDNKAQWSNTIEECRIRTKVLILMIIGSVVIFAILLTIVYAVIHYYHKKTKDSNLENSYTEIKT